MNEPKVRFKGFEGEWEEKKVGEILLVNSGKDYKHLKDGNIPVYGTGGYMLSVNESLSSIDAIGIGRKGTIDKPQYLKAPFWTVDTLFFLTTKEKDDLKFLYNLTQNINWKDLDESTGVPSLSKSNINEVNITIPSLPEQRRIASYFTHLDTLIEASRQKVEKLKQVKAASLQPFFPTHGQRTPKIRFKGCEGEWKVVKLGEMYERRNERNDLTYGVDKIISVANMYFRGDSVVSSIDYLRSYNIFKLGDIAFEGNKSKDFAHGRFVENSIGDGIVSHVFVVLKRKDSAYDLNFWKYYINNERIMGEILGRCTKASTMMNDIVVDEFFKESVLVPSLEEQQKIGKYLSTLDTLLTLERQRYAKLQQVKRASLTQMFA